MRRFSMTLLLFLLIAPEARAEPCNTGYLCIGFDRDGAPYGWTISDSALDPFENVTTATGGLATYYLWLECTEPTWDGMAAAEFDIVSTGPIHLATLVVNGFLNAGTTSGPLFAVGGCPAGPVVAAHLLVISLPGSMCLAPSANGILGTVDCSTNPQLWPMDWIGIEIVPPVSVEPSSWGRIKQHYR